MIKYDIDAVDKNTMGEDTFIKLQASHTYRQYNEIVEQYKTKILELCPIYPNFENDAR